MYIAAGCFREIYEGLLILKTHRRRVFSKCRKFIDHTCSCIIQYFPEQYSLENFYIHRIMRRPVALRPLALSFLFPLNNSANGIGNAVSPIHNELKRFYVKTPFNTFANRAEPDQAALVRAAWSGSTLFAYGNMIYLIPH